MQNEEVRRLQESYDHKKAELREGIEGEAQKLQRVTQAKESEQRDVEETKKKKSRLSEMLSILYGNIEKAKTDLENQSQKKSEVVRTKKREADDEKSRLLGYKTEARKWEKEMSELQSVAQELKDFIPQGTEAKKKYLEFTEKLADTKAQHAKINRETNKKLDELAQRNKDFDQFKTYVIDRYGRLASYVKVAKETLTHVNAEMEKSGMPLEFMIPTQKDILTMDNFDKERS